MSATPNTDAVIASIVARRIYGARAIRWALIMAMALDEAERSMNAERN